LSCVISPRHWSDVLYDTRLFKSDKESSGDGQSMGQIIPGRTSLGDVKQSPLVPIQQSCHTSYTSACKKKQEKRKTAGNINHSRKGLVHSAIIPIESLAEHGLCRIHGICNEIGSKLPTDVPGTQRLQRGDGCILQPS